MWGCLGIPYHVTVSSSFSARFLYGFPYRYQRAWTVLCNTRHSLDVVRVGAWNSLGADPDPHCCHHASEEVISLPFKSQTALLPIVTIFQEYSHNTKYKQINKREIDVFDNSIRVRSILLIRQTDFTDNTKVTTGWRMCYDLCLKWHWWILNFQFAIFWLQKV